MNLKWFLDEVLKSYMYKRGKNLYHAKPKRLLDVTESIGKEPADIVYK